MHSSLLKIAIAAVLVLLFVGCGAAAATSVTDERGLTTAVASDTFDVKLVEDIELSGTLTIEKTGQLDLNGHVLSLKSDAAGSVIKIIDGGDLTVTDTSEGMYTFFKITKEGFGPEERIKWVCISERDAGTPIKTLEDIKSYTDLKPESKPLYVKLEGGAITGGKVSSGGGGVYNTGTFTLTGGNIVGNEATGDADNTGGGGVYNAGTFTLSGGNIVGNGATSPVGNGGGVYNTGTFNMNKGKIVGNSAQTGGGVMNADRVFNMYGDASITGNTAGYGGGVYNGATYADSTFNMYDNAIITGNTAKSSGCGVNNIRMFNMYGNAIITKNTGDGVCSGGGVSNTGTFDMYGDASITENTNCNGGGVYVNGGTFNMYGDASITGNTAGVNRDGVGVCVHVGTFNVKDKPVISGNKKNNNANNVHLYSDRFITVTGALQPGAYIGIINPLSGDFAKGDSGHTVSLGDAMFFHPDDGSSIKAVVTSGEKTLAESRLGWFAKQNGAKIGETTYPTVQEAVTAANTGDIIVLLDDITEQTIVIPNGKTLTLDLKGHVLANNGVEKDVTDGSVRKSKSAIYVASGGDLTVTDTGTTDTYFKVTGGIDTENYNWELISKSQAESESQAAGKTIKTIDEITSYTDLTSSAIDGGLYVKLKGGAITGGTGTTDNSQQCGGGVYVNGGTLTLSNENIVGNTANNGGGVYVAGGTLTLSNENIVGNIATDNGGGVYVNDGEFKVSGTTVINGNSKKTAKTTNNVHLESGKLITVTGALTNGDKKANIYVANPLGKATQFGKNDGIYTITKPDADCFHPDSGNLVAKIDESTLIWDEKPVVKIGDKEYPSFAAAVTDASQGDVIVMIDDITEQTIVINKQISLDLNGHVLKNDGTGSVIKVESSGNLTVTDSGSTAPHYFKFVDAGPWELQSSKPADTKKIHPLSEFDRTAAKAAETDGYYVEVTGGVITGGTGTTISEVMYGGGVYVDGGILTLSNGNIVGNSAKLGGGVYIDGGTFDMYGTSSIVGNSATGEGVGGSGGVFVSGKKGTFNMYGSASITGNSAKQNGGGVGVSDDSTFNMYGSASITENIASGNGGGVYNSGTFNVKDAPVIKDNKKDDNADNVYLESGTLITVTGPLTSNAYIGIINPLTLNENFAQGAAANPTEEYEGHTVTSDDAKIFHPDDESAIKAAVTSDTATLAESRLGWVELKGAKIGDKTYLTVQEAVGAAKSGDTIVMLDDITEQTIVIPNGKTLTLDLNGHVLANNGVEKDVTGSSGPKSTSVIYVASGGDLTVTDTSTTYTYFKVTGGIDTENYKWKLVFESETTGKTIKTLDEITSYTDLTAAAIGDDLYVKLKGGAIIGGTGTVVDDVKSGGGVYVESGTLTLSNGNIIGNSADLGGSVYVESGAFNMYGTAGIVGNSAKLGGGVYIDGGTFDMYGTSSITGNSATGEGVGCGGGVFVGGEKGTFNMYDAARIIGNSAKQNGGGVGVVDESTFNIYGTTRITGNSASNDGGGVYIDGGTFKVSGSPVIKDNKKGDDTANNVYLSTDTLINLASELQSGAEIHITNPVGDGTQFGVADAGYIATQNDASRFFADNTPSLRAVLYKTASSNLLKWTSGYAVTFDMAGHGTVIESQLIASGSKVTKPEDPTAEGYTFGGWYKESGCTNEWIFESGTVTADLTLYAKWTANKATYTIKFNGNGGTVSSPTLPANYGEEVKLSNITATHPDGHKHTGWALSADSKSAIYAAKQSVKDLGDTTLYAVWTPKEKQHTFTVKVTHDQTGGATVSLKQGNVDTGISPIEEPTGTYTFSNVPEGVYTLVVITKDDKTKTRAVTISGDSEIEEIEIELPEANVNSIVSIISDVGTPAVAVDGADQVAENECHPQDGEFITVNVIVESKRDGSAPDVQKEIDKIKEEIKKESASGTKVEYLGITINEKTTKGDITTTKPIPETTTVLEFLIPYDFTNKKDIILYRCHKEEDGTLEITTLIDITEKTDVTEKADGTYWREEEKGLIHLYSKKFSTYSVSYVPTDSPQPSHSSRSSGSSVWAQATAEPTATPTPVPGNPEQTQGTPATQPGNPQPTSASPMPVAGVIAGLGAAGVLFGLRRK